MRSWFPTPEVEADVSLLEPSGAWTPNELWSLLTADTAVEWRDKVGVAGPSDGSAKTTTRLLASRGWVLKTRVDQAFATKEAATAWLLSSRTAGRAASVWHPDKLWAVVRVRDVWHPLTACPELVTLRGLPSLEARRAGWIELIQAGIDVHRVHGLGLDLNPSNFARAAEGGRLYYLDDEFYDDLTCANVATAIVARIPEERAATPDDWARCGAALRRALVVGRFTWAELADEIRRYPLSELFEGSREALLGALHAEPPRVAGERGASGGLVCVLADVHGNLAALEAVLREARASGADEYLFLGDAVGYGPRPAECVARLAELPRARHVRGNHDHAIASGKLDVGMNGLARECALWTRDVLGPTELAWLGELPVEQVESGWMAVHGAPRDPHRFLAYVYELTYEENLRTLRDRRMPICFYGHTHVQLMHVELAGGPSKLRGERSVELTPHHTWLVNPGSVGQPRDEDPRAAFALWDRTTGTLVTRRVAYDLDRTIRELRAADLPSKLELRLRAGA